MSAYLMKQGMPTTAGRKADRFIYAGSVGTVVLLVAGKRVSDRNVSDSVLTHTVRLYLCCTWHQRRTHLHLEYLLFAMVV